MNRFNLMFLVLFIGSVVLLLVAPLKSDGQDRALTTFSGRVVDEAGNPIEGLTIGLVSVFDGNGAWFPVYEDQHGSPIDPPTFQTETDSEGHFIITDVIAGPMLLTLLPSSEVDVQLLKAQIEGLFFYASGTWKRGIVFAVEQGDDIGNVEITVQYPHIRGKVQRANGTPIADEGIKFRLRTVSLHSESSQSSSFHTDAQGYFKYYVDSGIAEPTFYILSVMYAGQTVKANPIILKSGDPTHDMIFTFDSPAATPFSTQRRNSFSASASASVGGSSAFDVWVIRPENWHAYKMIKRERWESAQAQAAAEGAYLVAINDESEQNWLQAVFGGQPSWIGLNDIAKEGQWQWDNGEPLTYTNWRVQEPHDTGDGDEDYVIMGPSGKWEDVNPRNRRWGFITTAIIEKEEPPVEQ
ncbi:MAG: lectin-like protein [Candidatus Poribacteria bacterium]|nr:lectin-like protein [Candidatus Poribacteria bacterium]